MIEADRIGKTPRLTRRGRRPGRWSGPTAPRATSAAGHAGRWRPGPQDDACAVGRQGGDEVGAYLLGPRIDPVELVPAQHLAEHGLHLELRDGGAETADAAAAVGDPRVDAGLGTKEALGTERVRIWVQ